LSRNNASKRTIGVVENPKEDSQRISQRRKIFLNKASGQDDDSQIVVLGSTGVKKADEIVVQKLKNGNTMKINADGSYLVTDDQGLIVKTCDAMRVKREYSRDAETGDLMVKRFSLWTRLEKSRLDSSGTLFFTHKGVEIEERLNGLHIHTNRETG